MVCQCLADSTGCVDNDQPTADGNLTAPWAAAVALAAASGVTVGSCADVRPYCDLPSVAAVVQAACPLSCGSCGAGATQVGGLALPLARQSCSLLQW